MSTATRRAERAELETIKLSRRNDVQLMELCISSENKRDGTLNNNALAMFVLIIQKVKMFYPFQHYTHPI